MPGMNQKGPNGEGSMTGCRMGRCTNFGVKKESRAENLSDNNTEQALDRVIGRGAGRGMGGCRGMGRGRQNRFRNSL
jgi:hypothetical protein